MSGNDSATFELRIKQLAAKKCHKTLSALSHLSLLISQSFHREKRSSFR